MEANVAMTACLAAYSFGVLTMAMVVTVIVWVVRGGR